MKTLAVDLGSRRTGLAVCDALELTTRRLPVLPTKSLTTLADDLLNCIAREEVARVVIGLPLNMDGSSGSAVKRSQELAEKLTCCLKDRVPACEVLLWDERLTSFEAEQRIREQGIAKRRAKDYLDSVAAEVLLQDFLANR